MELREQYKLETGKEFEYHNDWGTSPTWEYTHWLEAKLSSSQHETVEQWEKRTGQVYPDDGPVWYSDAITDGYELVRYGSTKFISGMFSCADIAIIVANHHGKPKN